MPLPAKFPVSAVPSLIDAARAVADMAFANGAAIDRDDGFPVREVARLHETGLLTAPLAPAFGGAGLDHGPDLAAVLSTIGSGSLALGRLYEGHVNAIRLVNLYGDAVLQRRLARDIAGGALSGVWNTEPDGGGVRLGPGFVLSGAKTFASGAGHVTRPLITARRGDDIVMVVPRLEAGSRADLSGWTPQGMRASATGRVDFTELTMTPDQILGQPGDYHREPHFSAGAWRFLAVQQGGMARLLQLACRHLRDIGRDTDPHQRARIGQAAIAVETAALWVGRAAVAADDQPAEAAVTVVGLARLAVERCALDLLEAVQRSVGLAGFMRPHPLERFARDLATYLRQPAPDRALDLAAARVLERGGVLS